MIKMHGNPETIIIWVDLNDDECVSGCVVQCLEEKENDNNRNNIILFCIFLILTQPKTFSYYY